MCMRGLVQKFRLLRWREPEGFPGVVNVNPVCVAFIIAVHLEGISHLPRWLYGWSTVLLSSRTRVLLHAFQVEAESRNSCVSRFQRTLDTWMVRINLESTTACSFVALSPWMFLDGISFIILTCTANSRLGVTLSFTWASNTRSSDEEWSWLRSTWAARATTCDDDAFRVASAPPLSCGVSHQKFIDVHVVFATFDPWDYKITC